MANVYLKRFQPIHLKLENVGPFRSSFEMPITGPGDAPANFYLLASKNGFGKTTILDVIYGLMRTFAQPSAKKATLPETYLHPDLLNGGFAQLDIRIELESDGKATSAIISLFAGCETPPLIITPSRLEQSQAAHWIPLCLSSIGNLHAYNIHFIDKRDVIFPLLDIIKKYTREQQSFSPNGASLLLPTALYFTADRRILQPTTGNRSVSQPPASYAPAHKFVTDGDTWDTSLDGLLVWYEWLGGGLFEEAAGLVNELLFAGTPKRLVKVDRHDLAAVIEVEREDGTKHHHGIGQLSHGERSLMHLLVRSAYHKTGSTILMIDEMENHLHPQWQYRLMNILKNWIRLWPDLTVIASTHNPALLEAFAFERQEEGLVKGGYLIEANDL